MKKFIHADNLSADFVKVPDADGKNKIALSESIKQRLLPEEIVYYTLTINSANAAHTGTTGNDARRRLFLQDKFGYIHLDFTYIGPNLGTSREIFVLNASTPKPQGLIEVQTFDGGTIWLGDNQARMQCSGLTNGRRYIVDLVGFWRR